MKKVRENYVDFFLEFNNPDKFKEILFDYNKTKKDAIVRKEILKNASYFKKCIREIQSIFKLKSSKLSNEGIIYYESDLINKIMYRIKKPETILNKTIKYEAEKFKLPPRSNHINFKRYPFYDIYGIRIVVNNANKINKILVPGLLSKFKEVLPRKDYIKNPHENGYKGLHLFLSLNISKSFSPVIELQIQDIKMYEFSSKLDYHKGKYKKSNDYFSKRSKYVKHTVLD